jgi:hypothetical protein
VLLSNNLEDKMQIGGIIAIVIAAAVSGVAVVSLGLGLGLGLGLRKPCGVAKMNQITSPLVDYVCFDNNSSSIVPLLLSGSGFMKIGQTPPTVTIFRGSSSNPYYPTTTIGQTCAYEGTCVVNASLTKSLLSGSSMTNFTAFVDNPDPCNTVTSTQYDTFRSLLNYKTFTAVYLQVTNLSPQQPLPVSTIYTSGFGNTITVTGTGFLATKNSDGSWQYPIVTITAINNLSNTSGPSIAVPSLKGIDQCTLVSSIAPVYSCNVITLTVYGNAQASQADPNSFVLGTAWYNKDLTVSVTNTAIEQGTNCTSATSDYAFVDNSKRLFLFEAPEVTSVSPSTICSKNSTTLVINGPQFVMRQNADFSWATPTLTIGGKTILVTKNSMSQCSNMIASPADSDMYPSGSTLQRCKIITVTIPANTFSATQQGDLPIVVNNPAPFQAPTTTSNVLTISPSYCPVPPTPTPSPTPISCPIISNYTVIPTEGHITFCASPVKNSTQSLVIDGFNFKSNIRVQLIYKSDLNGNTTTNSTDSLILDAESVTINSPNQIVASFLRNIPGGFYVVNVTNIDESTCNPVMSPFMVPIYPIRWMTYATPNVVYNEMDTSISVFTIGFTAKDYMLALLMQEYSDGTFGSAISVPFSVDSATKVTVTISKTLSPGSYQVIMVADDGCGTQPLGPNIIVTNSTSIPLESVNPTIIANGANMDITITVRTPLQQGEVGISSNALIYLFMDGAGTAGISLGSVTVASDGFSAQATVPSNITVGVYDIIVVNQDGSVGTGYRLLTVTNDTVGPVIYSVTPDRGTTTVPGVITGDNFDTNAVVEIICNQLNSNASASTFPVAVTGSTPTQLNVNIPFDSPQASSICDVRVTNPSSGLSFTYSQITTDGAIQFYSAPSLNVARSGLVLVGGRLATSSSNNGQLYLYSIGGESNIVLDTVEVGTVGSSINSNGGITWSIQSNGLPSIANHGGYRISDMIYVVGGMNQNSTALDTVYRSVILDPAATPTLSSPYVDVMSNVTGLSSGIWYYAVSAVYPDTYELNPSGESLPSASISVYTPPIYPGMTVTLSWDAIPNASSYNIYRTTVPNDQASNLVLLDTVSATSYTDNGNISPSANGKTPLSPGSLGNWVLLPVRLNTKRQQLAVTASTGSQNFLYAIGGIDENNNELNSYEYLSITVTPATQAKDYETHTLGSWILGSADLPTTKVLAGATVFNGSLYVGPGKSDNNIYSGVVSNSGDLGSFSTSTNQPIGDNSGSCFVASTDGLYVIGTNTQFASCNNGSCDNVWEAIDQLVVPVTAAGCTNENGLIFVAGGESSGNVVGNVEYALA